MQLGLPTAADMNLVLDKLASAMKVTYATLGRNASAESGTSAATASASRTSILSGLSNVRLSNSLSSGLDGLVVALRYDTLFRSAMRGLIQPLELAIQNGLPSTWTLQTATSVHVLDAWLSRLNGASGAPSTPANPIVLTGATSVTGGLTTVVAGSAPRIVFTHVGATDGVESLISAESTQVALTGSQNAYTCAIAGTVPTGVMKVRVYRGLVGGGAGTYYWDQDVAVTAGSSYPSTIKIEQPDSLLRTDITPPSWMQCGQTPEAAALIGSCWASNKLVGQVDSPLAFVSSSMLAPGNVLLGPSNAYLGLANQPSSGVFCTGVITGSGAITNTAGTIQSANNAPLAIQGFGGATGLRARVTTSLANTATIGISYHYYDAAHGWGNLQATTGTATFATGLLADTIAFTITAGRVVVDATITSVSGAAITGAIAIEGVFPRSY